MNIRTTSVIMRAAVTLLLATCTVLQARQNPKFAWTTQLFLEQQRQEQVKLLAHRYNDSNLHILFAIDKSATKLQLFL